jgi:hypothetical protein
MTVFQTWVDDLVDTYNSGLIHYSSNGKRITTWPYSSFFDWFENSINPGFIPAVLGCLVGSLPAGEAGMAREKYSVNNQYVFIGLNPNFPKQGLLFPPQYKNGGHFLGFNMDSASKATDYSIGKAGTLSDFWKICGLLQGTIYQPVYDHFRASYMTDIAVCIDAGNSKNVVEILNDPKKANLHFNCLKMELEKYKKYVFPTAPTNFSKLTFCIFGGEAYSFFAQFVNGIGEGLFRNAKIVQLYHYSRGGAVHTMQNLFSLYLSAGHPSFVPSSFVPIEPSYPIKWS